MEINKKMKIAWFWLSLLILIYTIGVRIIDPEIAVWIRLLFVLACSLYSGLLIFVINAVRGSNVNTKGDDVINVKLGAWSYVWRGLVAYFGQIVVILIIQIFLPLHIDLREMSYVGRLGWFAPSFIFSTVAAWLLFSRDREGQFKAILGGIK